MASSRRAPHSPARRCTRPGSSYRTGSSCSRSSRLGRARCTGHPRPRRTRPARIVQRGAPGRPNSSPPPPWDTGSRHTGTRGRALRRRFDSRNRGTDRGRPEPRDSSKCRGRGIRRCWDRRRSGYRSRAPLPTRSPRRCSRPRRLHRQPPNLVASRAAHKPTKTRRTRERGSRASA